MHALQMTGHMMQSSQRKSAASEGQVHDGHGEPRFCERQPSYRRHASRYSSRRFSFQNRKCSCVTQSTARTVYMSCMVLTLVANRRAFVRARVAAGLSSFSTTGTYASSTQSGLLSSGEACEASSDDATGEVVGMVVWMVRRAYVRPVEDDRVNSVAVTTVRGVYEAERHPAFLFLLRLPGTRASGGFRCMLSGCGHGGERESKGD
jgi:hypothetical protein